MQKASPKSGEVRKVGKMTGVEGEAFARKVKCAELEQRIKRLEDECRFLRAYVEDTTRLD